MPTLSAMNCAAAAELVQHAQEDVALVRGNLAQPQLLAALDVRLHRVLDRPPGIGDGEQACAPVVGVGHPLDVAVTLQLVERRDDARLVGADRLGERGLGTDRRAVQGGQNDVAPHRQAVRR
jgi:hypothetical protein